MAEGFASPTGSLADGAERLERLIRGVKDRQFSEALNAPAPKTVSNAFVVSPEEAWSKKFMTAGIGPNDFKPAQMPVVSIVAPTPAATLQPAPKALEPALAVETRAAVPAPQRAPAAKVAKSGEVRFDVKGSVTLESPGAVRPGPIGRAIAKPARKRGWFGRLVSGN